MKRRFFGLASSGRARPFWRTARSLVLCVVASGTLQCRSLLELCTPAESQLGFFSKGDCAVTRAAFFQGHEWLTWFGNRDLPESQRFSEAEVHTIAEGNRRVDWPKELMVHLNNGVLAYAIALSKFTNRPENQREHFLLSDKNRTPEAASDALEMLTSLTREAAVLWPSNRTRALTLIGRAQHLVQDSFSPAHAVREPDNAEQPWCVRSIKAFIERADGYATLDILYHGVDEDEVQTFGHTTPEDSLYRPGRDCHEPTDAAAVESCLSVYAQRARLASRDYLQAMRDIVGDGLEGDALEAQTSAIIGDFEARHMDLCQ